MDLLALGCTSEIDSCQFASPIPTNYNSQGVLEYRACHTNNGSYIRPTTFAHISIPSLSSKDRGIVSSRASIQRRANSETTRVPNQKLWETSD
jgi:hypothetical protein